MNLGKKIGKGAQQNCIRYFVHVSYRDHISDLLGAMSVVKFVQKLNIGDTAAIERG